ncbi:Nicotinate-nucleotide--dimethylbenzimidazole phosphoribosyltransferase [Pseudoruegeria aquimaris]|uniref:Nicotinate-nucleotide--dimethylbenzimidazole phosphoribosyltransferase n=1 Tax=Pseudoruegeria aquimaris TaxID=393663 RepID=A0A1Y5SA21_9RHOB|nr:nicotinate-nucleotide--dimethylbenzimidazole phosphoribosyltransferase [Pseudoruegeria aquimaris]SLN34778.1 Nicotinate-nucleotide--dimethylbenzimidazole phosphoribosyltransferase [Pseudoruegeria aquimaris]
MSQSQPVTLKDWSDLLKSLPKADAAAAQAARARNGVLTKPPGALGRLEDLAIWYAGWRGTDRPSVESPQVIVFAGNHGVAARGVSAFPGEVTVQMVANFEHGGAAINQLCKAAGAALSVVPLDLDTPTADFTQGPAMNEAEFLAALAAGWNAVDPQADLLVVGEMGIANTTSAAAIYLALHGGSALDWTGLGTGISEEALPLKAQVVADGVAANPGRGGLEILANLGGRELAAMAGAVVRARVLSIPVIMDGFVCTAALSCLARESADALDHVVAGHGSAEQAHGAALAKLGMEPLLDLGMRLGEASGGALAIQILKGAVACHSGMATFAEAGVSEG